MIEVMNNSSATVPEYIELNQEELYLIYKITSRILSVI